MSDEDVRIISEIKKGYIDMPTWINVKKPYRRAHFGETCSQCYPASCSCPMTKEEEIAALKSALGENVWTPEERIKMNEKLQEMVDNLQGA